MSGDRDALVYFIGPLVLADFRDHFKRACLSSRIFDELTFGEGAEFPVM